MDSSMTAKMFARWHRSTIRQRVSGKRQWRWLNELCISDAGRYMQGMSELCMYALSFSSTPLKTTHILGGSSGQFRNKSLESWTEVGWSLHPHKDIHAIKTPVNIKLIYIHIHVKPCLKKSSNRSKYIIPPPQPLPPPHTHCPPQKNQPKQTYRRVKEEQRKCTTVKGKSDSMGTQQG